MKSINSSINSWKSEGKEVNKGAPLFGKIIPPMDFCGVERVIWGAKKEGNGGKMIDSNFSRSMVSLFPFFVGNSSSSLLDLLFSSRFVL